MVLKISIIKRDLLKLFFLVIIGVLGLIIFFGVASLVEVFNNSTFNTNFSMAQDFISSFLNNPLGIFLFACPFFYLIPLGYYFFNLKQGRCLYKDRIVPTEDQESYWSCPDCDFNLECYRWKIRAKIWRIPFPILRPLEEVEGIPIEIEEDD